MRYEDFIANKHRRTDDVGIDVDESDINPKAFDFQRAIIRWALKKGRAGLFEGCGLGKTIQELEWASQIIERGHAKRCLLLCPVAVASQVVGEAEKFGIKTETRTVRDSSEVGSGINVTNYDRLHKFDTSAFDAVILNEASILKNEGGVVRRKLTDAFADVKWRLTETATPAPNDHMEIGTQAEFLGWMQNEVMKATFFIHDGGDTSKWRLRKHGQRDFWNWVASWSVAIERPSSIGFSDEGYELPDLRVHEEFLESDYVPDGFLFNPGGAIAATHVHTEKRGTIEDKAARVAELVNGNNDAWAVWCDTNYEADALLKVLPDAVEVRGGDKPDAKEEKLTAFTNGDARVIITKPEIGGFGLNWQHCHKTTYFAGFSFERWYQSVRRFWRFGQDKPVDVHLICSDAERGIVDILRRKQVDFERMANEMSESMREGMWTSLYGRHQLAKYTPAKQIQIPEWLS